MIASSRDGAGQPPSAQGSGCIQRRFSSATVRHRAKASPPVHHVLDSTRASRLLICCTAMGLNSYLKTEAMTLRI